MAAPTAEFNALAQQVQDLGHQIAMEFGVPLGDVSFQKFSDGNPLKNQIQFEVRTISTRHSSSDCLL